MRQDRQLTSLAIGAMLSLTFVSLRTNTIIDNKYTYLLRF